ncbi:Gldg family protein [Mucilaginibacter ginsenosidivorax]|uniref:ABC transporter permease subunit n=1 Tax=Mucilaginibacter ginsenosidivorax TaxID=862126 RepID=A0A5B8W7G4_9SPHI|nr:Gldg family protein [Mucilaginibacter ginsenosidivorax]QEC78876.1 ABC transporter permease subunit [Mucilaginibacter ginsenosidivorax]
MKKTLQIARLELSLLFYSPIAWLLMIVLFLQVAYGFVGAIESMQRSQEWYKLTFSFLTSNIFTKNGQGIFSNLLSTLYLYIPLVTMSLISRETSSGTIKLLYSSPLKISEIILGKFLAMMTYNLLLIGLLALVGIGGALSIDHFGYQQVMSALLGIYLLLCAYAAIGLFMSSLTTYQVVAAISTFMVFAFLSLIGSFWQDKDFLRDLAFSLSMPGRTFKMLAGFLTTRDVIYFFVIVYIFIALTISKLHMARDAKNFLFRMGVYAGIVFSGLTVSYLSSRQQYTGYYDATATKRNTLRLKTQEVLGKTGPEPIEITEYVNFLDGTYGKGAPDQRLRELDRWEPYLRFKPNINLKWVYYYDSIPDPYFYTGMNAGKSLQQIFDKKARFMEVDPSQFRSPREIHRMLDLREERNRLVMQVKYKGRSTFLRVFDDNDFWPGETEVATALKRLMVKVPKILFVNDGYERSIDKIGDKDYKGLTTFKTNRSSLVNRGFAVDSISLQNQEIPPDATVLVIADRRLNYNTATLNKLRSYIQKGGNLFVAAEGSKQQLNNALLNLIGVHLQEGTIVQPSKDFSGDQVTLQITAGGAKLSPMLIDDFSNGNPVLMPGVSALSYTQTNGFSITPLLMTSAKNSWNRTGKLVLDSANLVYSPKEGDQKGALPTAIALTRKVGNKQQKIIITGDADFLSNKGLNQENIRTANFNFANALFSWFADGEFPIFTAPRPPADNTITVTAVQVKVMKVLYLGLVPGLMLVIGSILLIRRKRK